jgi:hypothetical protein
VLVSFLVALALITALLAGLFTSRNSSPSPAAKLTTHYAAPAAGQAVDTTHPDRVIGDGIPSSCTSAAVVRAVAAGGIITFDCGAKPIKILMSATARVSSTEQSVVLDGGDLVTLSGEDERRILFSDTCKGPKWGACTNQSHPNIVVQNITFANGYDAAHQVTCSENIPKCGYGGVDGGGAIYVEGGQFKAVNSRFTHNTCYSSGPDLGGGAIRALLQFRDRPIYITHDTFDGGRCSNGGALSSINVGWYISDSLFTDNKAVGNGANPARVGTAGGGNGGAIYLDGTRDTLVIRGTVMTNDTANEGGGALFDVVDSGSGSATLIRSKLNDNISGRFETSPGVFYQVDQRDKVVASIDSTAN